MKQTIGHMLVFFSICTAFYLWFSVIVDVDGNLKVPLYDLQGNQVTVHFKR